jgi:hypothetical protein
MGFWIFSIQAHPCHLTANSPPSLQPFVSARCPTPVAYSLPHCFAHVLYPFVPVSLRVLTCSSADRIFKPQFRRSADYEISNGFLHSSQFTVHSSQLAARSSQLTPRLFRFLVDRLIPATELSKRPSEKLIAVLIPTSHEEFLSVVSLDQSFQIPVNKTSSSNIPSKHETYSPHSNAVFPENKLPNQVPDQRACTSRPGGVSTSAMAPVRSSDDVLLTATMNRFVHVRSVASPQPIPPSSNHIS